MDKRLILAIVLSAIVMISYPYLMKQFNPPKPKEAKTVTETKVEIPATAQAPGALPKAAPPASVKEEFTTVDTPMVKAVFSSVGGSLRRWELKKYEATLQKESARSVNLSETVAKIGSLSTQVRAAGGAPEAVIFQAEKPEITVNGEGKAELVYSGATKSGLRVEKKFSFTSDNYIVNTEIRAVNATKAPFEGTIETTLAANVSGKDATGYHTGPIISAKKVVRQTDPQGSGNETPRWIGLEDKYFLSIIIPSKEAAMSWSAEIPGESSSRAMVAAPLSLAPGEMKAVTFNSFIGPKEYDLLLSYKLGLEESIEFGYFSFMAKPFLVVLNFFEKYLGNYGLAIIILTILIKVIFYPLTKHSLKSMNEMKKIQPQLAAIKERYKDNKEKMNKELMELYKRYKVNPVGGCLPMVLQIPVFIALYEVLYVAIELRHAPLFLWIRDLSDKDPYYITPLIMGATMFIQQKMTPTSVDPSQAKIMLIMPIVFTFMFLNFPSGLVIYWLVNNVLSIAQQYYIQREPAKA
ncbi:MAG: membrane protein insertase YidC [Deltaproteobacteria bacterium]|nr:membrane protein insertase YidC [Deltaproteobacteria bacterium]